MKYEIEWIGFPAAACFVTFKLVGMLTCSWWWILPICMIVYVKKKLTD